MKKYIRGRYKWFPVLLILLLLIGTPVLAATLETPATIDTGLTNIVPTLGSTQGVGSQMYTDTFYAADRHWVFYMDDDSNFMYKSSDYGGSWDSHVIAETTGLYAVEYAVWYDEESNTVHYARHNMTPDPDEVAYRMGTPNVNGTITWAAAEQVVSQTPADLITWRTIIAVDKNGYPWVAWIDTNGEDAYGIVYVESSSTKNGTWTESVAEEFDLADCHSWFVSLTPLNAGADTTVVEVNYSIEDQTGGENDGKVALWSQVYDNTGAGSWVGGDEAVVDWGDMNVDRPDAFDFYESFGITNVVYTGEDEAVYYRERTSLTGETWAETAAAASIKDAGLFLYLPTISGYEVAAPAEDLIVIVHDDTALLYSIYDNALTTWGDWTLIWETPGADSDAITRHNAAYRADSPMGFCWQYTPDFEDPIADTVLYWWADSEGGVGWFDVDNSWLSDMMGVLLASGFGLALSLATVMLCLNGKFKEALITLMIAALGVVLIFLLF